MMSILSQRIAKVVLKGALAARRRLSFPIQREDFYFGYGANIDPSYVTESGLDVEFDGVGVLLDHELEFSMPCEYRGVGYASVNSKQGQQVLGSLYKIDPLSLALLDIMEWVPFGAYRRKKMNVDVEGRQVEAYVYVAANPRNGLSPPKEYLEWLVEAGNLRGFSTDYLKWLGSHKTCEPNEINVEFDLLVQNRVRPLSKIRALHPVLRIHDRVREKVADAL